DGPQRDVVNSLTMETTANESRNMLVEAARIARGAIRPLSDLKVGDFAGLIIPGGFGVAKNLCTFAFEGSQGSVNSEFKSIVEHFHAAKKPIGAVCIAPAAIA